MTTSTRPRAARAPADPALAQEVWGFFLQALVARRQQWQARVTAETGLSFPQSFALQQIPEDRPEPMRALADCLQVDPSAITGLVDRLEAKGLVERRADPDDRRVKTLVLTPHGRKVRAHLHAIYVEPPQALQDMSPERLRSVREFLAVLASAE